MTKDAHFLLSFAVMAASFATSVGAWIYCAERWPRRTLAAWIALLAVGWAMLATGCTSVTHSPDGATQVRTLGASTVTVRADGAIETQSPGLSEGFTKVLAEIPEAVLRLLAAVGTGLAGAAK